MRETGSDGGEALSARPPARTIPIKLLRNWMSHNYGVRVLITITEQVNSSPGLRIPAADGAPAPVGSLKTFPQNVPSTSVGAPRCRIRKEAEAF